MKIRQSIAKFLLRADEEIITKERRIELEQYEKLYNKMVYSRKRKEESENKRSTNKKNKQVYVSEHKYRRGKSGKKHISIANGGNWQLIYDGDYFSKYSTLEKATAIRNFLIWAKWDKQYLPQNVTGKRKNRVDEYYLSMKPYLMNNEYEKWLEENKGWLEEY